MIELKVIVVVVIVFFWGWVNGYFVGKKIKKKGVCD